MRVLKPLGFFFFKKRIAEEKTRENNGIEVRSSRLIEKPKKIPPVSAGINNNQIKQTNPSMQKAERRSCKRSTRKISLLFILFDFGIFSILFRKLFTSELIQRKQFSLHERIPYLLTRTQVFLDSVINLNTTHSLSLSVWSAGSNTL